MLDISLIINTSSPKTFITLIVSNELSVLDLGDYEYRYYERKNNTWRLIEEFNDKIPNNS